MGKNNKIHKQRIQTVPWKTPKHPSLVGVSIDIAIEIFVVHQLPVHPATVVQVRQLPQRAIRFDVRSVASHHPEGNSPYPYLKGHCTSGTWVVTMVITHRSHGYKLSFAWVAVVPSAKSLFFWGLMRNPCEVQKTQAKVLRIQPNSNQVFGHNLE